MSNRISPFDTTLQDRIFIQMGLTDDPALISLLIDIFSESSRLNDEIQANQEIISCSSFICPHCQSAMKRRHYPDIYESFDYWDCDCKDGSVAIS